MFHRWLNMCLQFSGEWRLFPATNTGQLAPGGVALLADNSPFPLGNYVILAPGMCKSVLHIVQRSHHLTDALPTVVAARLDPVHPRTFSANITGTAHVRYD
jgi:hypothetical protein